MGYDVAKQEEGEEEGSCKRQEKNAGLGGDEERRNGGEEGSA